MRNLYNDLATITNSNKDIFNKLVKNSNFLICNYLEDTTLNNENLCTIDIGIGVLKIVIEEDTVRYSFIPSKELETEIINTLENNQSYLTSVISSKLTSQLNKLYDNLL